LAGTGKPNLTVTKVQRSKHPIDCVAKLDWKCLFMPTFLAGDFDQ